MYRCIHIFACLTVLTTALPPGWCCWMMSSGCCLSSHATSSQSEPIVQAETSASGSSCCQHVNPDADTTAQDEMARGSADAALAANTQRSIPPLGHIGQCCQRGPLVRVISFDFLVNPLLVVASHCETPLVQPHSANPADVDISAFSDTVRLHARLSRWVI